VHAWAKRYAARAAEVGERCRRARDGLVALDAETLLGEVDWAVEREDAHLPSDFFMRRTDLGYGPAAGAAERVLVRMADLCGWDARQAAAARGDLIWALHVGNAWKLDPAPETTKLH